LGLSVVRVLFKVKVKLTGDGGNKSNPRKSKRGGEGEGQRKRLTNRFNRGIEPERKKEKKWTN